MQIEQLKLLKARNVVERTAKDLEEKMLMASMKNNQLSKVHDWKCFVFLGGHLKVVL